MLAAVWYKFHPWLCSCAKEQGALEGLHIGACRVPACGAQMWTAEDTANQEGLEELCARGDRQLLVLSVSFPHHRLAAHFSLPSGSWALAELNQMVWWYWNNCQGVTPNSFSPPVTFLLFFLSGLNDPAPAAVKETSENNQWSMFEVQRRVSGEGEREVVIVGGLRTHSVTLEKQVITHTGRRAAVLRGSLA